MLALGRDGGPQAFLWTGETAFLVLSYDDLNEPGYKVVLSAHGTSAFGSFEGPDAGTAVKLYTHEGESTIWVTGERGASLMALARDESDGIASVTAGRGLPPSEDLAQLIVVGEDVEMRQTLDGRLTAFFPSDATTVNKALSWGEIKSGDHDAAKLTSAPPAEMHDIAPPSAADATLERLRSEYQQAKKRRSRPSFS